MWVIFLEAGIALALVLIVVWATWPKRQPDADRQGAEQENDNERT